MDYASFKRLKEKPKGVKSELVSTDLPLDFTSDSQALTALLDDFSSFDDLQSDIGIEESWAEDFSKVFPTSSRLRPPTSTASKMPTRIRSSCCWSTPRRQARRSISFRRSRGVGTIGSKSRRRGSVRWRRRSQSFTRHWPSRNPSRDDETADAQLAEARLLGGDPPRVRMNTASCFLSIERAQ